MDLQGPCAHAQASSDGRVGPALGDKPQYLPLSSGEGIKGPGSRGRCINLRRSWIDHALAVYKTLQRVDENSDVGYALLEQVAHMGWGLGHKPQGVLRLQILR